MSNGKNVEKEGQNGGLDEEMTSPEVSLGEMSTFNYKKFILGLAIGLVAMILIIVTISLVLFYRAPDVHPFLAKAASELGLPVASVNGELIGYADLNRDFETVKYFNNKRLAAGALTSDTLPTDISIKNDILNNLIDKALVNQLAKKYGISVSDYEVQKKWTEEIIPSFGNQDPVKAVKDYYNMTLPEYQKRVVYQILLYDKANEAINYDATLKADAKKRAEAVLVEIKKGEKDFATLANQYSEDPQNKDTVTGQQKGGDLGWFSQGMQATEVETAAFSLEKGKVSDLIEAKYGYYIVKLEDKKDASKDGKTLAEVKASDILIRNDLDTYLTKTKTEPGIKKYLNFGLVK